MEMAIADVVKLAQDEKYSRMPVYQDNIDNIIGVLNAKDLLGLIGRAGYFRIRREIFHAGGSFRAGNGEVR